MTSLMAWQITATALAAVLLLIGCGFFFYQRHLQRHYREKFLTVTDNISEGMLIIGRNRRLRSYNGAAVRLLGATVIEQLKQGLFISDDPLLEKIVEGALGGDDSKLVMEIGEKPCQLIAHPIREGNRVTGAVLLLLDITEKEGREKLRREFTANVSHELKTPLTSISGFAEIIRAGIAKEEDVQHFAENIYNESQRLINLVEDIIKLSRLDENTVPLDREDVDMQELIRATINHLEPLAMKKQICFDTRTKPVTVHGVPRILDEIVFNLCENAVKYNRSGGRVIVTLTTDKGKPVLQVRDTGIGIPADEQERVFERFYRVDKSHSRAIGGTGLGLSIVKHGVQFHDGTVQLESEPGMGTTVTVTFPR